jgi:hypothetical protein
MSGFELNTGRLVEISMEDLNKLIEDRGINAYTDEYYDLRELVFEEFTEDPEIIEVNGKYYIVEGHNHEYECYSNLCEVTKLPDGSIKFLTYHHNGGAHWTELLEDELD